MKKKYLIIYYAILMIFTGYVLLDTFLIPKSFQSNISSDIESTERINEYITDDYYSNDSYKISINTIREYDTNIYIADIEVSNISFLKTYFANNTYGKNIKQTTSSMAREVNAVLAINGDYYGFRDNGFVIRNSVIYRSTSNNNDSLLIMEDGRFQIVNENETDLNSITNIKEAFSFGPVLVNENEITVGVNEEISGKSMVSNPRTAIGIIDNLHYIFVVSDGRTESSEGLSLYELANVMKNYNCSIGYNLDGGGSSTMYFNGRVINNPTTNGNISERKVSDIIYVG